MNVIATLVAGTAMLTAAGSAIAQESGARGPIADLTREQAVARADERFQRLDADRDGRVSAQEMQQVRQARRGERQGQLFDRLDTNRDGSLSRDEFAARRAMRDQRAEGRNPRRGGQPAERRAQRMFGSDGVITREEFRARALQRFERLDADRDGRVTVAERRDSRQRLRQDRLERRLQAD